MKITHDHLHWLKLASRGNLKNAKKIHADRVKHGWKPKPGELALDDPYYQITNPDVEELVAAGFLEVNPTDHNLMRLTEKGKSAMKMRQVKNAILRVRKG